MRLEPPGARQTNRTCELPVENNIMELSFILLLLFGVIIQALIIFVSI